MNRKQRGFTLIELMMIVSILGVLLAIAIPQYQSFTVRTKLSEALVILDAAKTSVSDYYQSQGAMPPDASAAGLATVINSKYVHGIDYTRSSQDVAMVSARIANLGSGIPNDETIVFEASGNAGAVHWDCKPGTVPTRYLTAECRQ